MLLNLCLCSCRKTLLVIRILLVIWTPALQQWDQGTCGRFSYLWTSVKVSEIGCILFDFDFNALLANHHIK